MPAEQLNTQIIEDTKILEYLKIKDILQTIGGGFGFTPSDQTSSAWVAIARSTRYLDEILDSGAYENAPGVFSESVRYILGLGESLPDEVQDDSARDELKRSQTVLARLGYGERLAIQHTAEEILKVDGRIKQAKTTKDLERWRSLEGMLTADIFINAVAFGEKFSCERFDEFAEYARSFYAFGNNMDTLSDFKEDSGTTHQVEASLKNRTVFAVRSLGSLAAVMKLRGPLHNPISASRVIMKTSSNEK